MNEVNGIRDYVQTIVSLHVMWLHRFGSGLFIYTARHLQNEILEVSLLSIYPLLP